MMLPYFRARWIWAVLIGLFAIMLVRAHLGYSAWLPPCLYTTCTGQRCPGCGMTTALLFLLDVDLTSAYAANRGIFVVLPALIVYGVLDFLQFKKAKTQMGINQE